MPDTPPENAAQPVSLWQRIVQSDGPWTRVAWTCPTCECSLFQHYPSGGCGTCDCTLSYADAERQAWKAAKTLVGAP